MPPKSPAPAVEAAGCPNSEVVVVVVCGVVKENGAAVPVALGAAAPKRPVDAVVVAAVAPKREGAVVVAGAAAPKREVDPAAVEEPNKERPPEAAVVAGAALPKVGKGVEATVEAGAVAGAPKEKD